ncbi:pyridoxamine 5'-phosphate oxidase family protein [Nereida sp. MMG025]|uniref:pyridoxamine 5'-phosphate oxidase family protein n=1 Tax=Nereida sp. MMG025 TaxID=2909981 RepID=UPI001F2AB10B|nr:pyridoxamine 5'-phosphate oxidase family protein [Nereida sp. MMG025]MCF6445280.1 pyridoxamine 5'-phosphate oxidase family protein [Nereida sp. MMG025]
MAHDLTETFWDRLSNIRAGMLSPNTAAPRPMAHTAKKDDNAIWFITADGTDVADAAKVGDTGLYQVACAKGQLYAWVKGTLSLETQPEKLDEIWSPMAAVWFDDGRSDDDIRLVRFTPSSGEAWTTDGNGKALFEFAKSQITGTQPDVGDQGNLMF